MTSEQPDDRTLDNAVRRRGSRYVLRVALAIGLLTAAVVAILSIGFGR